MFDSSSSLTPAEENKALTAQNRHLRNRLFELYSQLNALTNLSKELSLPKSESLKLHSLFQLTKRVIVPGGAVYSAAVSPLASHLAFASFSGSISIHSSSSFENSTIFKAHSKACRDLIWNSDWLVSVGFDKYVRFWDVDSGKATFELDTNGLANSVCGFDTSNIYVAAGKSVFWIDPRKPTPIQISTDFTTTAVSVYKNFIIYGGYDEDIFIVDKRNLRNLHKFSYGATPISSISKTSVTGKILIVCSELNPILLDLETTTSSKIVGIDSPMRYGCRADIVEKGIFGDAELFYCMRRENGIIL